MGQMRVVVVKGRKEGRERGTVEVVQDDRDSSVGRRGVVYLTEL